MQRTSDTSIQAIFVEGGTTIGYGLYLSDGGTTPKVTHFIRSGSSTTDQVQYNLSNLDIGKWYTISGIYDGDSKYLSLIINEGEVASKNTTITSIGNASNGWRVGGHDGQTDPLALGTSYWLSGYLSSCMVWDTALTTTQIMGQSRFEIKSGNTLTYENPDNPDQWISNMNILLGNEYPQSGIMHSFELFALGAASIMVIIVVMNKYFDYGMLIILAWLSHLIADFGFETRTARTAKTARVVREATRNLRRASQRSHLSVPPVPPMPPMPPLPPDFDIIKSDKVIGIRGLDKRLYREISNIARKMALVLLNY